MATQTKIAEFFGISKNTVKEHQEKLGLPTRDCDLQKFAIAYTAHLREIAAGRGSENGEYDLTGERARLAHHQANKTELEELQLRGELIPADVVEKTWSGIVSSFRAKMLSIPSKLAGPILGITDITEMEDELKEAVHEALQELSDYDPKQYGVRASEANSLPDSTAAGS